MKIFILIAFVFSVNIIYAQEENYPKWLLNTEYYNNSQYAVGISDPLEDSAAAAKQAIDRSLINYGIFHKGRYASLTAIANASSNKNYNSLNQIETILYNSLFYAKFALTDSFEIIKKDFSPYGECFVLLQKTKQKRTKPDTIEFTLIRRIAFYNDEQELPVSEDEIEIKALKNNSPILHYTINRNILSKYKIYSAFHYCNQWNEMEIQNKFRNYSNVNIPQKQDLKCSENLTFGFWAAFIFALSDQISIYSTLNRNKTQRLVSINQGNIEKNTELSSVEVLYNTKKIEIEPIDFQLKKINIQQNNLNINTSLEKNMKSIDYSVIPVTRKEKKYLRIIIKEGWQDLNIKNIEQAYYARKYYQNKEDYISGESITRAGNLSLGIIHGILLARLGIETQMESKITALSSLTTSNTEISAVKSSKSLSNAGSKEIFPYFFFIQKINNNAYSIETKLFYKTN